MHVQLAKHNKDLAELLKPSPDTPIDAALEYYEKHTAQIEVRLFYLIHTLYHCLNISVSI